MKQLSELRAETAITAAEWQEQRGIVASVQREVSKGLFVNVSLGSAGVKVFRGDLAVGIELDELIKLAVRAEPALGKGDGSKEALRAAAMGAGMLQGAAIADLPVKE